MRIGTLCDYNGDTGRRDVDVDVCRSGRDWSIRAEVRSQLVEVFEVFGPCNNPPMRLHLDRQPSCKASTYAVDNAPFRH